MYFVEMIKLVENFTIMMGDEYILRIYYDSIFDLGIKEKPLEMILLKVILVNIIIYIIINTIIFHLMKL